jgi:hypothetical protein
VAEGQQLVDEPAARVDTTAADAARYDSGTMPLASRGRAVTFAAALAAAQLSGCAVISQRAAAAPATGAPAGAPAAAAERQTWLEMYARGYYAGRSGQLFLVTREGDFIVDHDPLHAFMHGSAWGYDTQIPLLLHGAPFIRQGEFRGAATQQDIAPTLAALIGATPPSTTTGRALQQALGAAARRPRVVMLIVLDGARADYFDTYRDVMPTFTRMRREGAWFPDAQINYLPTETSVGHATIGTGADPRIHGQAVNNLFNRVTGKPQPAYAALDPRELMALTLADVWNIETDGHAVIIGQGGALRATAGLIGHGACVIGGRKVIAASYSVADAGWETNPACYRMSDALEPFSGRLVWEAARGTWMGHDISNPTRFRASSLYQRFEADAFLAVLAGEPVGADAITDLVMVNLKGPDYVGHAYGPDSPEMKEEMAELDRQMTRILDAVDLKAGPGQSVVAATADHGMPPEPAPGRRHYSDDVIALIHQRFDPAGKAVVQYFGDTASGQLYLDTARLRTLGVSLKDVAALLESQDFIQAAFTEDEVRAALKR